MHRIGWLIAIAACGTKTEPATSTPAGSARPVTTDAKGGFCVPADFNGILEVFTVDDHAATVCLSQRGELCATVDLATGAYTATAKREPPPAPPKPFVVNDTAKGVSVCKGAACTKLALPVLPTPTDEPRQSYEVDVSANGARAVATMPSRDSVVVFDTRTGKRVAKLDLHDRTCIQGASFLGDTIYVAASACNGEATTVRLFTEDGAPRASFDKLDVAFSKPTRLDGDRWAIAGTNGSGFEEIDVKTGQLLHLVASTPSYPMKCCQPVNIAGSAVSPIAQTPSGRLVEFAAGVSVIDQAHDKLDKNLPLPICPKP